MKSIYVEIISWYGASAVLLAYVMTSFSVFPPESAYFQLLNFTGAIALAYAAWRKKIYAITTLNLIWMTIALISLLRLF